ncbi:MAG: hypothetical protein KAW88_00935 [Candidatus Cloacimonetes bacterium]|nr:hypothetical protein [Candidatus Cloacimonadota bacterium]
MQNQFKEFIKVFKAFDEHKVEYILIGGVALILHGIERLTRHIDIFVRMVPTNIKKLRKALYCVYEDLSIKEITLEELQNYPVIRYGTPDGFYIDIITHIGKVFGFEDLEFKIIEFHGIKIKIATPETLYKLKKDTVRSKDKGDAIFLKELIKEKGNYE